MREHLHTALSNARQINGCVRDIIENGPLSRCSTCTLTRCRERMPQLPPGLTPVDRRR